LAKSRQPNSVLNADLAADSAFACDVYGLYAVVLIALVTKIGRCIMMT